MITSAIVLTEAEYDATVKAAKDRGYEVASMSNSGLSAGMRLTFLPAEVFKRDRGQHEKG